MEAYMMIVSKTPETRLNVRLKPELKAELERLAEWNGLTLSSYAHMILVKAVRKEKEQLPELFQEDIRPFAPHSAHRLPLIEPGEEKQRRKA